MEPTGFGHATLLQRDERILHHAQGNFVLHFHRTEAWGAFLDQETFHLVVFQVAGPDDGHVTKRGVTDPFFLPVQNPGIPVAPGGGGETTRGSGANPWLGQPKGPDLLPASHGWQPLLFLLL